MIIKTLPLCASEYDTEAKLGWLCPYYTHGDINAGLVSKDYWRYNTYSPAILDYKAGGEDGLDFFVSPFIKLMEEIIKAESLKHIALVPLPSSKPKSDPNYKTVPNPQTNNPKENRDNRNIVFCGKVSHQKPQWKICELIERIKLKDAKSRISSAEQLKTLAINKGAVSQIQPDTGIILVDDVFTLGDTLTAAKSLISKSLPKAITVGVVLGKTTH